MSLSIVGLVHIYVHSLPTSICIPCRFLESHWFTWATQMSHLPMHVDRDDKKKDWVTLQVCQYNN